MQKIKIFKTYISVGLFKEMLDKIISLSEYNTSAYVCFANVHMVVEAYKDESFNNIVNRADITAPDGLPLSKYLHLFKGVPQERVAGPDMMPKILEEAEKRGKSVFFYGSTPEVLAMICQKAQQEFPHLKIAGCLSPPFRPLTPEEDDEIVDKINTIKPDFVFVSLGCPKQEKWMYEHHGRIHSCMLGVGQAFSLYAGIDNRAPKWMQSLSLEWAYRLLKEPKRLWKRYCYTNSVFLYLVVRTALVQFKKSVRSKKREVFST